MTSISCVWIIFTLVFLGLSIFHFIESKRKVAEFNKTTIPSGDVEILGLNIRKFVNDVNSFVDGYNASTTRQNRYAAVGYLLAAVVAIFSMVLGIINKT
ncbi:hypothetical protein MUO71_02380 [Candidatus Bathyarchaeota archaeon]|nr:hypothetical protein [Candidatus Bathyarchaeota archaeon]